MTHRFTRYALALAVAAMGVVDLWSAFLSRPPDRLIALRHLVPTEVLDTSRSFTLLAGALLLVTAWGLRRGKRRAFVGALLLCAVSVPVNMLKAFDFEEASAATALMFLLGISGQAFQVESRALSFSALRSRALLLVLGLAVYAVGGCWLLEILYAHGPSLARAFQEAGYQLFGIGSPTLEVPRNHHVVSWYLGSIGLLSITTLVGLALAGLQPAAHRRRHRVEHVEVEALLRRYGDNSVSAFALDPAADYFFSHNRRAVIAYRFESDTLLVIGDPIGPPEEIRPLLEAFAAYCHQRDWQFAFYQARPERLPDYKQQGWRAIHIGEDPVLWTERFTLEGSELGALRRNVRRLERDGLEARMFVPGQNPFTADDDPDDLLAQMSEISAEWLRGRAGGERGFCMGRFDPAQLGEVWLGVAWHPGRRRVEAFCTWVPVWARRGWAIDLMRRRGDALSGATEFLIVKSVEHAGRRGRGGWDARAHHGDRARCRRPGPAARRHHRRPGARVPDGAPGALLRLQEPVPLEAEVRPGVRGPLPGLSRSARAAARGARAAARPEPGRVDGLFPARVVAARRAASSAPRSSACASRRRRPTPPWRRHSGTAAAAARARPPAPTRTGSRPRSGPSA